MDDDGGMGMPNWGYYDQPLKRNIGLQLMPTVGVERDTKPLLSNGAFLHRDCGVPDPSSVPMEFVRDSWIHHRDNNKILHALPMNPNYALLSSEAPGAHTLQMLQPPEHSQDDKSSHQMEEAGGRKETPLKKRSQGRAYKVPKPKKPKKNPASRDETNNPSVSRGKAGKKSMGVVINGIDLDISGIPTPVCSCTGTPQPCYRWGIGGWQSACCTTSMSMYPLPMSPKRRGARIAGRKMSQGAFKKVLERLAGEGYNLGNPIDLRPHWAKHGTNKFVTIR